MCASIGNNSVKYKLYYIISHYPVLEMITGKGEVIESASQGYFASRMVPWPVLLNLRTMITGVNK